MLWNASKIHGYEIAASDGRVGTVSDLLFDDASWQIRWLVVETGYWLSGRKVLLPVSTLGHADTNLHEFSAKLTMAQVMDSPDIDTERPVSRQMEASVYTHYGWHPYWRTGPYMGPYGYGSPILGIGSGTRRAEDEAEELVRSRDDLHLRSISAVDSYHIRATDGEIGHVEDMLVEEADWSIHHLVVDTKNWWPGKKVLISPNLVKSINWNERDIDISVDRQAVKDSPLYDVSMTIDHEYENKSYNYYRDNSIGSGNFATKVVRG